MKKVKVLLTAFGLLSAAVLFTGCTEQKNAEKSAEVMMDSVEDAKDVQQQNSDSVNTINQMDTDLSE